MSLRNISCALPVLILLCACISCTAQDSGQTDAQPPPTTFSNAGAPSALAPSPALAPATPSPVSPSAAPVKSGFFAIPPGETDPDRYISWRRFLINVAQDQKPIYFFPASVAHGHHLIPTLTVAALTAGLIVADRYDTSYFHNTRTFNGFNHVFNGAATAYGMWAFPLGFDAVGWMVNDHYAERTAELTAESVLDSEILTAVMKDIDRRWRPWESSVYGGGDYEAAWFKSSGHYLGGAGSFPSGHTIAAFSIATVFADRYGAKHKWAKFAAYGLAGVVGFSRVSLQSHFPSDVFLGAVLGYSISNYVVLRR